MTALCHSPSSPSHHRYLVNVTQSSISTTLTCGAMAIPTKIVWNSCVLLATLWITRATAQHCVLPLNLASQGPPLSRHVAGLLNGINGTAPDDDIILGGGFSMWRGPIASWLWPSKEECHGFGTCCNQTGCAIPFSEAARVARLGMRQQYILDGVHFGQTDCEYKSLHGHPHSCPLPGGPGDPQFALWNATVTSAALEAKRRGLLDVGFDIWNEPNGQMKVECLANDKCTFDANLTQVKRACTWSPCGGWDVNMWLMYCSGS
jgi:hypothetical protein